MSTATVVIWSLTCWCGEFIRVGTDYDGGLIERCPRGHESRVTIQRAGT